MRLYVHMMLCGSVCTLLYLFCNRILPYELPLRWRRFWIRINMMFYLLPVPWFAAEAKELVRWILEKAGMMFPQSETTDVYDATSVWQSFWVLDEEGRVVYVTGYRELLPILVAVLAVCITLIVGWVVLYVGTVRCCKRSMVFFDDAGHCLKSSEETIDKCLYELQDNAGYCLRDCHTKRRITVGISPCVTSPMTVGLFRPVILFPIDYHEYESAMEEVILHEQNHVSCMDIVERFFAFVIVVLYFFNPLSCVLFQESITVSEMLSDEAAVSGKTKQQKANYIRCIIEASQKAGNPRLITPSLGISKSLLRKRMEQIMGTNKKKVWKKSAVVGVVAVCALAGSIPALTYRKPHAYVQDGTNDWSDKDMLVFAKEGEENPMEGVHTDFSQGNTVFVGGQGNDCEVTDCNIRQGQQEQSQSICAHDYRTGTIAEHESHADGSCTVVTYGAQQCAKCGSIVRSDEVSSFTYKSCPHTETGGVEPDHPVEDEMETGGAMDKVESLASEMGVVNTDALKVRSAAEQDAAVIALLEEGAVAKVVAEENGFYRILLKVEGYENPLDGYVRKEYLNLLMDDTAKSIF